MRCDRAAFGSGPIGQPGAVTKNFGAAGLKPRAG